jgi:trans-aconitate methyltransferase
VFRSRFGQAADPYVAFRPEYPAEIFERILGAVGAERRERFMDLGAGTGKSTRALRAHFAETIAVEPDAAMAEKLSRDNPGAIVRVLTAEECEQETASVDLVAIAAALYWMDAPRVMANVLKWLRVGGVVALWAGGVPLAPEAAHAVTSQEFADRWNRFRDSRLDLAETPEHARRAASALAIVEEHVVSNLVWLTPHDFVGFWRSTSYGSAYARELAVPEAYWRGLETRYSHAWPKGKIPVDFRSWLLLARKD